jgi:hypothetical protein
MQLSEGEPATCPQEPAVIMPNKKKGPFPSLETALEFSGSPGRTRTCDKAVNSRLLYQLSYRGSVVVSPSGPPGESGEVFRVYTR